MSKYDYLVIGGGVAGITAADTIRENDSSGTIAVISEEDDFFYSRLNLHFYLKGDIPLEKLFLWDEDTYKRKKIVLFKGKRAQKLDISKREVILNDGQALGFGKLLIATGVRANSLSVKGADLKGVFCLRTIKDAQNIKERIEAIRNKNPYAIIAGGSFIALDFATSFVSQGLNTKILVRGDYFWRSKVDRECAGLIEDILKKNQVEVLANEEVDEILGEKEVEAVKTKSGKVLKAGIIGTGIGTYFDLDWLKEAGIKTGYGVLTNEYLETNISGIFAAGDICQFYNPLFKKQQSVRNWTNAYQQGKVAGSCMLGRKLSYQTVSVYTVGCFGVQVSFIGVVDRKETATTIVRGSRREGAVGNLLLNDGLLIGAVLVNRPKEQQAIIKLIKSRINLKKNQTKLSDANFNLERLFD